MWPPPLSFSCIQLIYETDLSTGTRVENTQYDHVFYKFGLVMIYFCSFVYHCQPVAGINKNNKKNKATYKDFTLLGFW